MRMSNSIFKVMIALVVALTLGFTAKASEPDWQVQNQNNGWRDRMLSEKIAFFTSEIGLSPAEAEKFWPIYNQISAEEDKLLRKVGECYFALERALDSKASETEVANKLNAYMKALQDRDALQTSLMSRYSKVLSKEKIAKLYVAEEKFRRQQIHRLHIPTTPAPKSKN